MTLKPDSLHLEHTSKCVLGILCDYKLSLIKIFRIFHEGSHGLLCLISVSQSLDMFENLSHHVRGGNKSDRLYVVAGVHIKFDPTAELGLTSYKFRNFASKERIFISSLVPYERYKVSSLFHFYNSFNLPPKFSFCYSVIFVL